MRKFTASFLIAFTLWGSLISPAKAVLPLIGAAYLASVEALGATMTNALIGSVALHASIAAITFTNDGSQPAANGSNVAIQIQLDPYVPLTTPESAVPLSVVDPVITENVVNSTGTNFQHLATNAGCFPSSFSGQFGSALAGANAMLPAARSICPNGDVSIGSVLSVTTIQVIENGYGGGNVQFREYVGCPSGTTLSGGNCVQQVSTCPSGYLMNSPDNKCYIQNPDEQQVADAKIQVQRLLNEFQKNPNDPDPIPENLLVRPKDIVISSPERTTKVHINDDGTIEVREISAAADGNTNVDKLKLSAPGPGQAPEVVSKSNQKYSGQERGLAHPESTVPSPVEPGTSSGSPTDPAGSTTVLNLPANLAKTEKQCGYDPEHPCTVEMKGKQKIDEEGTPDEFQTNHGDQLDVKFDELQTFINQQQDGVGDGMQNPLIGKFGNGQCVDPVFDVSEVHASARATIPICGHMSDLHPWLALFAYVMSAIAIYRIWFTRVGGTS